MKSYSAYGLNIHSEISLPELMEGGEIADVIVRFGPVAIRLPDADDCDRVVIGGSDNIIVFWKEVGGFCIRNGNEIIVDPTPGIDRRAIGMIVLGSALGILLSQRDCMVFHSSVIEFPSGCVAFMAAKGYGKSTTAAAFYAKGHRLVADDIMVLEPVGDGFAAKPGYPQMKLWPDAAVAIGENPSRLDRVHPDYEKRARPTRENFASKPVSLRGVFLLDVGDSLELEQLKGPKALIGLLPHWYGAQFDGELLKVFGLKAHFNACSALASKVPIYNIKRPHTLDCLDEVLLTIEKTLGSI